MAFLTEAAKRRMVEHLFSEIRAQLNTETSKMTTTARIAELEKKTQEIQRELTKLKNLPTEPPVGEVVKFTKRYGSTDYTYAALHTVAGLVYDRSRQPSHGLV